MLPGPGIIRGFLFFAGLDLCLPEELSNGNFKHPADLVQCPYSRVDPARFYPRHPAFRKTTFHGYIMLCEAFPGA